MVAWNKSVEVIDFEEKIKEVYKVLVAGEHLYRAMKLGIPDELIIRMIRNLVSRLEGFEESIEQSSGKKDDMGLSMCQIISISTNKFEEMASSDG